VFTIGECGHAMQASICPECKEPIGNTSHIMPKEVANKFINEAK
jgi:hypothetical protein